MYFHKSQKQKSQQKRLKKKWCKIFKDLLVRGLLGKKKLSSKETVLYTVNMMLYTMYHYTHFYRHSRKKT